MWPTTIYALCAPDGEIRYIGKTSKPLCERRASHVYESKHRRTHKANWIRSLGAKPLIKALCVVPHEYAFEMEIRTIASFKAKGYRLVNQTPGGDGVPGWKHTPEARARMSAACIGNRRAAVPCPPEKRAAISAKLMGRSPSAETRAKLSAAGRGLKRSPETRARLVEAWKVRKAKKNTQQLLITLRSS